MSGEYSNDVYQAAAKLINYFLRDALKSKNRNEFTVAQLKSEDAFKRKIQREYPTETLMNSLRRSVKAGLRSPSKDVFDNAGIGSYLGQREQIVQLVAEVAEEMNFKKTLEGSREINIKNIRYAVGRVAKIIGIAAPRLKEGSVESQLEAFYKHAAKNTGSESYKTLGNIHSSAKQTIDVLKGKTMDARNVTSYEQNTSLLTVISGVAKAYKILNPGDKNAGIGTDQKGWFADQQTINKGNVEGGRSAGNTGRGMRHLRRDAAFKEEQKNVRKDDGNTRF